MCTGSPQTICHDQFECLRSSYFVWGQYNPLQNNCTCFLNCLYQFQMGPGQGGIRSSWNPNISIASSNSSHPFNYERVNNNIFLRYYSPFQKLQVYWTCGRLLDRISWHHSYLVRDYLHLPPSNSLLHLQHLEYPTCFWLTNLQRCPTYHRLQLESSQHISIRV